jgi:hypothetical protein
MTLAINRPQEDWMVPAQCYERVIRVNVPGGHASAFTINRHDRQWLVTAGHVVEGIDVFDIQLVRRDGPISVLLESVPADQPGADIALFLLDREVTPDLTLYPTSDEAVFSQDAYFLGFPYGLGLQTAGITYPFVKKAILSASEKDLNGVTLWWRCSLRSGSFKRSTTGKKRLAGRRTRKRCISLVRWSARSMLKKL